jgi:hypothetical protein
VKQFWIFLLQSYELLPVFLQIYGHFQYPVTVSGRISGNLNPVYGLIPDVKKTGLSGGVSGASLYFTISFLIKDFAAVC